MIIGKCWRQKPNARNEHPDKEGSPYLVFPLTDLNVCQAQIAQFSLRKTIRRVLGEAQRSVSDRLCGDLGRQSKLNLPYAITLPLGFGAGDGRGNG
jgi:hypothetical protein